MEHLFRCLILSIMTSISCQLFYETIVPHRIWRQKWIMYTTIPAFAAGFLAISFAKVPPFILRPIRIILVTAVIAQIYFQIRTVKNFILSVLFCGIYWGISTAVFSIFSLYPDFSYETTRELLENLIEVFHLSFMIAFHYQYKNRIRNLTKPHWEKIGILPLLFLITVIAINMISGSLTVSDNYARFTTISGVAILALFLFYYVMHTLEKEEALQKLQLRTEHAHNQAAGKNTLISIIDNMEDTDRSIIQVTVSAYLDNGQWKVHLSQDFINAFFGNMFTDIDSENIEQYLLDK